MNTFWKGKRVFITGHTGFKGGWLTLALSSLGAEVSGYGLKPATGDNLFDIGRVNSHLKYHALENILDAEKLKTILARCSPDIVFHLAAQPLVRASYEAPLETFAVNALGTANLLEAVKNCNSVRAVVVITTDKCYENKEWYWGYRETDRLGGRDPYSASKACAELVTSSYQSSFFSGSSVGLATARAGNVIGGGDWSDDRLLPDCFRALRRGVPVQIRNPFATRPWQHVLEPVNGYITLAKALFNEPAKYSASWNFGPGPSSDKSVGWVLEQVSRELHGFSWEFVADDSKHEAGLLRLDSSKAINELGWTQRWEINEAIEKTLVWHQAWLNNENMEAFCLRQISEYQLANDSATEAVSSAPTPEE